jgi:glycosyltransferase involved in cell wall biosynthesis
MLAGSPGAVVYRAGGSIDAIDEYSRRLVQTLQTIGAEAEYFSGGPSSVPTGDRDRSWILLQYNPFSYGRAGFAPTLVRDVIALRRRSGARLALMIHEAWVDMTSPKWTLVGVWQRAQLRALLPLADTVLTSTEALAREVRHGAVHVPIATTITPVSTPRHTARQQLALDDKLAVAVFGRGNPSRALDHAEHAIDALAGAHGAERLAVLNIGADAPKLAVRDGVDVRTPGALPAEEVSRWLLASDIVLLPFTDGLSTRRTTLMAALAHGRAVLGLSGRNTDLVLREARDAIALTPAGDLDAFSRAAVELTTDPGRLDALGAAGQRLYEARFDWPVLARTVASILERPRRGSNPGRPDTGRSACELVFVCHDIGGSGGMEQHTEQLITRLLDAGLRVTVIARTCKLEPRDGLRFERVHTPARPFALAYPAFFLVASLRASGRRDALLHTTGAIIANRADVCTVHYCHTAASTRMPASRASRTGRLYRVNAAIAAAMSRLGEAWCYRPGRTRLLCAVSGGVADELIDRFPSMAVAVRSVPNGVDSARFRPDGTARVEVRSELGLDERTPLALFVGGDWERKGLSHAVDALVHATEWHLAVAGPGDPEPLIARARNAGTVSRLRFLGPVRDMPRLYAAGDAFVLPTAYEAFPLVALEAAASGLPLLITRVNGAEELLRDGRAGHFITSDGRDIGRRLNELSQGPERARQMATAARAAGARYSWDAMAETYLSVYDRLSEPASATAVTHR